MSSNFLIKERIIEDGFLKDLSNIYRFFEVTGDWQRNRTVLWLHKSRPRTYRSDAVNEIRGNCELTLVFAQYELWTMTRYSISSNLIAWGQCRDTKTKQMDRVCNGHSNKHVINVKARVAFWQICLGHLNPRVTSIPGFNCFDRKDVSQKS